MGVLPGLAALAAVATAATGGGVAIPSATPAEQATIDVDTLMRTGFRRSWPVWPGVRDSTEQTVVNPDTGVVGWAEGQDRRVRTVVAPIKLPWLGEHVLYLEEFPQDEPDAIRRQMVLQVEAQGPPEAAVRVRLYAFTEPARWPHLDRRARLTERLRREDLVATVGCALVRLDLADQGGRGRFTTPDGRALELTLHSQDWPFSDGERDSLLLMLRVQGSDEPISSAWAEVEIQLIDLNIGWLRVRCGPLVPDTDELQS